MRKEKFIGIILLLVLFCLISVSPGVFAGKAFYWLVTDGEIDSNSVYYAYSDQWIGSSVDKVADFQWYVDKGISRSGALTGLDKPISGTKATVSLIALDNDLQLTIEIIKGSFKKPSAGPEIYQWTIIDGKNSDNDCICVVFTDLETSEVLESIWLYEGDVFNIRLPSVLRFECSMQLI